MGEAFGILEARSIGPDNPQFMFTVDRLLFSLVWIYLVVCVGFAGEIGDYRRMKRSLE